MSIFDNEDIITQKYLKDRGFAVFDNYAILGIKLGCGYLSRNIVYWFKNKEVVLYGMMKDVWRIFLLFQILSLRY